MIQSAESSFGVGDSVSETVEAWIGTLVSMRKPIEEAAQRHFVLTEIISDL